MWRRVGDYVRRNHLGLLCLFLILGGGTAWALANNSVKSKHIVNGQVKDVDLAAPEDWHLVGTQGEPVFGDTTPFAQHDYCESASWGNTESIYDTPTGFFRDPFGIVHLKGSMSGGRFSIHCGAFKLPLGYRPGDWGESFTGVSDPGTARIVVFGTNGDGDDGEVQVFGGDSTDFVTLDGITFRCGPAGQDGCP